MKVDAFGMRDLLERTGFRLRGARRADCIHCQGHSRGTVSFTAELAFCHRCKWRANTVILARELGLLQGDSQAVLAFREETQRRVQLGAEIERFEAWRDARIREVSNHYYSLFKAALRASKVLTKLPDCEEAWEALARFYHTEAQLSAAFDWLTFTKAGEWLEEDSTPVEVFQMWRSHAA